MTADLFEHIHSPLVAPAKHNVIRLRDYQLACVDAVHKALENSRTVLYVMATGTGKTAVFAKLIDDILTANPTKKALVLAHRRELIDQAAKRIYRDTGIMPEIEMGADWAQGFSRVVVSSIQTQVAGMGGNGRMTRFDPNDFAVVVMDEAHRAVSHSWMKVQDYYLKGSADLKCILCTATPRRGDKRAMGLVAEECAFQYPMRRAIDDGWICSPVWKILDVADLDYSHVRTTAGELNQGDVAKVLENESVILRMVDPIIRECGDMQTLIFAQSVAQAKHMVEVINRYRPDKAGVVHGKTDEVERKELFRRFEAKEIQYFVNVGIVTEGTDLPGVEAVVMARPTKSVGLYEQMVGRGVRTAIPHELSNMDDKADRLKAIAASSKPHFLVMEFEGNAGQHAIVSLPDVLAGNMTLPQKSEIRKRAKAATVVGEATDIDKALDTLRAEEAKAAALAKRAAFTAVTKYHVKGFNPWEVYGLEGVKPPKSDEWAYKIKTPEWLNRSLEERGIANVNEMASKERWRMYHALKGKPTMQQIDRLAMLGYDRSEAAGMTPERAKEILDEYRDFI